MKIKEVRDIISNIHLVKDSRKVYRIDKGWSSDEKYFIECDNGKKFLLRINSIDQHDVKEKEFMIMRELSKLGIIMSYPFDVGISNKGQFVYILLSWIEGKDVEEVITTLIEDKQYSLGVEAGNILKKLHSVSAPKDQEDWEERMIKKINYHLERFKECRIKVPNDEYALKYIKENLHLLKNRPQVFQQGDFHVGNLILTPDDTLGVIDFNRWDYGDPYEEFYKMMMFSREVSIPFARGQIYGYFGDEIPEDFFKILALYLADVSLYSVVWAAPYGEEDVNKMLKIAEMIFNDFNNFTTVVPGWFPACPG
ncbi:MAG: aminoglycoside phosphotransferase family protein [Halanaerobiales bacterium]